MPDGTVVHNPLRVLPNDGGSEVAFTLFKGSDVTNAEFEADAELVRDDLERVRTLV
ncbi:hypothetical protein [Microbacterium sp. NPDC076911]|uniref:hypothetical protein n=1 Tax=Microbacterium sp. NPDC076911 TaxID=3154958 RepID=UPI003425E088